MISIPLSDDLMIANLIATVIVDVNGFISTIDHFLASVYAYGLDHMRVIVDGN